MDAEAFSIAHFGLDAPVKGSLVATDAGTSHDPLTGVLTQAAFATQVARLTANTQPPGHISALFRIDLDRFIGINDCFGFATGDILLTKVAQRLEAVIADQGGIVGRLGQDEFVIFIASIDGHDRLVGLARQLLQLISQPFQWNQQRFFLTASIGIALASDRSKDVGALMDRAGLEQKSVRNRGRNGFQIARPNGAENRAPANGNVGALRRAIEREEIFLLYQPILNVHSRQVVGVEALLRWRHPEMGVLTPDRFLPLANETGLIVDLGDWALSAACSQVSQWDQLGFTDLNLCVNFSSQQLQIHKVAGRIESILSRTQFDHSRLSVELGGTSHGEVDASLTRTLREIKESGVNLALDNFGVGQVSLDNLHNLPLDSLKIDRSVVRKISTSAHGESLVKALTLLGKSFGLRVEAEGVETTRQFDLLDREGCNNAQGYLLSRPLVPDAVLALLQETGTASSSTIA
jgi:diguanylate cyclase (GGDEF)-like protein